MKFMIVMFLYGSISNISTCFTTIENTKLWYLTLGNISFNKINGIDQSIDIHGCLAEKFCQACPHFGHNMFLTIVDDFIRVTWTHSMKCKSDSVALMTQFLNFVITQFHTQVQTARRDNAPDLIEGDMK